jgi:hypothetical protein
LAADAVQVEPVSTLKFPANREINREFFDFGSDCSLTGRHSSNDSEDLERNSLLKGTGNSCEKTGNLNARTGNLKLECRVMDDVFGRGNG